jgi:hypothetical protein
MLDCYGWIYNDDMPEVLISCSKLTSLTLNDRLEYDNDENHDIAPILSAVAEYGLQLQELSLTISNSDIDICSPSKTRYDMITIPKRLRSFKLTADNVITDITDPESSICSMFSSPGVDLRILRINIGKENTDMIAKMLQGCYNMEELDLSGLVDMSPVMMKISVSCRQLVELTLGYQGSVDGAAMKALLISCSQLQSLTLFGSLVLEAYENLAFYGGNIHELQLSDSPDSSIEPGSLSFSSNSPLYDPSFKQQRKRHMEYFHCELCDLDVNSSAKLLSCFGLIEELSIRLDSSQLPVDAVQVQEPNEPLYCARQLFIIPSPGISIDSTFLAFMSSCKSLRGLTIQPSRLFFQRKYPVDASTLIKFACEHSERSLPLVSLSYPEQLDLSPLKELLPKLKLIPL